MIEQFKKAMEALAQSEIEEKYFPPPKHSKEMEEELDRIIGGGRSVEDE